MLAHTHTGGAMNLPIVCEKVNGRCGHAGCAQRGYARQGFSPRRGALRYRALKYRAPKSGASARDLCASFAPRRSVPNLRANVGGRSSRLLAKARGANVQGFKVQGAKVRGAKVHGANW